MSGVVAELWRYPVKSMQGERVEQLSLGSGGAVGDRMLAVVDAGARKVLSGKRYAELLMASARLEGGDVVVTLPDGAEYAAGDPGVHAALSAWLDKEVRLEPPPTDAVYPMEMYTGMSDESTPVFDWPGPPGTWLDLADAHFLTTSSLRAAAALHPDGVWDVRRFRPTALVETDDDGFVEDGWSTIALGAVETEVIMKTPRCSMPSRAQPGFERDMKIGTTIRDGHDNNLGVYCAITQAGLVAVGDAVEAV
ncbi:MAG TPA: MOSC N-terminal beta barrel domain-containing protein [Acidimicrobiales bacterium]|nr:MOSC N-terminal beta barrel domain-containing protein [Acidimicrobiales bacterium]